ncbi:MAG: MFS transporter [Phycisphaerales bacterium]|nr:MFS transporter [Phycisphaerales bacterium]
MKSGLPSNASASFNHRGAWLAVTVAALGYFVDLFDIVLFSILRIPSLKALGVTDPAELKLLGKHLLDLQLTGMLCGGLAFGMLGDKFGRLKTLFGSILLYSIANLLNAFVTDVWQYEVLRFAAGFGLAGELGAGITLVSELLPTARRGLATTLVAAVGLCGAVAAGIAAQFFAWNHCYLIGGILGLVLLALRVGVSESGLFQATRAKSSVSLGNPFQLLWPPRRCARFACIVLGGMPIWFVGGVMFIFAPEIGTALECPTPIMPAKVIMFAYSGVVVGDIACGLLSQYLRSRRYAIISFQVLLIASIVLFLECAGASDTCFYWLMAVVGAATGFWAVIVTTAGEQFGTNLRATAATSAPNFIRATAVPVTWVWFWLSPTLGVVSATMWLGIACCVIGIVAVSCLQETFDRDLDYLEH